VAWLHSNPTIASFTYTYDYENRLVQVDKVVGGKTTTVKFKYDPFGRRIQKRVSTTQNGQNVVKTYIYIYDREDVIIERLSETIGGGTPTVTTKKYVHGPGVDEPLAVAKGANVYYYHADGLGSVVALTDFSEATVEGYNYDTFGNVERFGNAVQNTYGFTGREYDIETGLYYYRARYYDPETGRFISKDPIGFAGGDANLYNYVLGDPINWTDPWGLAVYPWTFPPIAIYDYVIPPSVIFAGGGVAVAGGAAIVGGFGSIPMTGPAGALIGTTGVGVVFTGISTVGLGIDMYFDLLRRDFGLPLDLIPNINFFPKKEKPVNDYPGLKPRVSKQPLRRYGLRCASKSWLRSGRPFLPELKSSGFPGRFDEKEPTHCE